jgi:hypothetical protein
MQGADASTDQGASGFEHTAASADALLRLGVMFALKGCDALALLTDTPEPGIPEACDCIEAAAHHLAYSAEFSDAVKGARGETP